MKRVFTRKAREKKTATDNDSSDDETAALMPPPAPAAAAESIDGFEINKEASPEYDPITTHLTASTRVDYTH